MEQSLHSRNEVEDAVPKAEGRSILLRAYADVPYEKPQSKSPVMPAWMVVFDTETTPDESQQLRFGTYQILKKGKLREKGLFYDKVSAEELETLKAEAPKHGCVEPRSLYDFVHQIFLLTAFRAGGLVVGFNYPLICRGSRSRTRRLGLRERPAMKQK